MKDQQRFLKIWQKSQIAISIAASTVYFLFGTLAFLLQFDEEGRLVPGAIDAAMPLVISFVVASFLCLTRNRGLQRYHEKVILKEVHDGLKTTLYIVSGLLAMMILFYGLEYYGLSESKAGLEPIANLLGLMLFIFPLRTILDFYTILGEARLYFKQAIGGDGLYWIEKGADRLEKYLRTLEIGVSSRDLVHHLNLAKIKNQDVDSLLRTLLRSIEKEEPSLYEGLKSVLGDDKLIGKVKRTTWREVPKVLVLKPELLQALLIVMAGIIAIVYFFLTGKVML